MYTHRKSRRGWRFFMEAKSQVLARAAMLFSAWLSSAGVCALTVNGVSTYQELNHEYYLAALYGSENQSDATWWLNPNHEKKMVMSIRVDRWTPRAWFKKWQNNLAINNPIETYSKAVQTDLIRFSELPKDDLIQGDQIVVHYRPNVNTSVYMNDQLAMAFSEPTAFHALLNTWLGQLPPSRLFKRQILGLSENPSATELTKMLQTASFTPERKQIAFEWFADPEVLARQAEQEEQRKLAEKQALRQRLAREAAERSLAKKLQAIQEKREAEIQRRAEQEKRKQAEQVQQRLLAEKQRERESKRKQQALLAEQKRKAEQRAVSQKYFQRYYEWQLQTAVRNEITYPEWARKFKEEGLIEARFKINAKGLIESVWVPDTAPSMLAAEMRRAINSLDGKQLPPKELKGQSWQFSFVHHFKFGSNRQAKLVKPEKPNWVEG